VAKGKKKRRKKTGPMDGREKKIRMFNVIEEKRKDKKIKPGNRLLANSM